MAHLTSDDKAFFKENGYLIKRGLIDKPTTDAALDLIWENMDEGIKRDDPSTWYDQGYKVIRNVGGSDIVKGMVGGAILEIGEELVGKDTLGKGGGASPHLAFPRADKRWNPPGGHLDGYYTPTNGVRAWQRRAT